MNISIITWTEDIYYNYLQVMKSKKILYYGYWNCSLISEKNYSDTIGIELNYGNEMNKCNAILVRYNERFITIPDSEEMYKFNYQYESVEFTEKEILKLVSVNDIKKIREININDIILCWFIQSNFRDYFSTVEDYKKALSREVYFSDYEEINNDIENGLLKIFNIENGEIVNIEDVKTKKLSLYLNNGIVWEAFLKDTENNIYLNTGLNISLKIL